MDKEVSKNSQKVEASCWKAAAASVQGTYHKDKNLPCQDAHYWIQLPGGMLVAAVADGAGSSILGHIGASLSVRKAVETIKASANKNQLPENEKGWHKLLTESLQAARAAIQSKAEELKVKGNDLATTLILTVGTLDMLAAAQVGDGAAVAMDSEKRIVSLTVPQFEEYINVTKFLTSPDALESAQINIHYCIPGHLAVFSDGFQMLALKMPEGIAHEPLFKILFHFLQEVSNEEEAQNELKDFLQSSPVTQRTDDDITLLLAMRK